MANNDPALDKAMEDGHEAVVDYLKTLNKDDLLNAADILSMSFFAWRSNSRDWQESCNDADTRLACAHERVSILEATIHEVRTGLTDEEKAELSVRYLDSQGRDDLADIVREHQTLRRELEYANETLESRNLTAHGRREATEDLIRVLLAANGKEPNDE